MTPTSLLDSFPHGSRILIIRLRSIGDIVLLTPALRLLKEWRPELRVSVLVESRFRELLEGNPDADEILELKLATGWDNPLAILRIAHELRQRKFALCLNLHGGPTSAFLTGLSGAQWKVGFHHFRTRWLYDLLIPDARTILGQSSLHTAEHQASALFYLGLPKQAVSSARLSASPTSEAWWREKQVRLGISPEREYAVLHLGALYATKRWAPENFARLGIYLEHELGIPALYACGPGEAALLDSAEGAAGAPLRRLENITLGEFAAILARAHLFVGNDSGPAHMAAALSRPSVVIFGSSSSRIWGPWPRESNGRLTRVVQNFYECNPCPGDRCYQFEQPECILSVGFDQVRAAVEAVLGSETRKSKLGNRP